MIKQLNEKRYSDGSLRYLHICKHCNEETYLGRKNKTEQMCKICFKKYKRELILFHKPGHKHNLSKHKFYSKWATMKARCYNKNNPRYSDWGGRGIKVCDEWKNDSETFIKYIELLENSDKENYTIDRIDNNKNYQPGNLKWSTIQEQNLNQRKRKTNTGEYNIHYETNMLGHQKYRVLGGKRFKTLEEAIIYRNKINE